MKKTLLCYPSRLFLTLFFVAGFHAILFAQAGFLDASFGGTGKVTSRFSIPGSYDSYGRSISLTSQGEIIMGGDYGFGLGLVKYKTNGTIDSSFGVNGMVTTNLYNSINVAAIVVQPDDKILVAAEQSSAPIQYEGVFLLRYLPNGNLDSSFGTNGIAGYNNQASGVPRAMVLQPDGRIVIVGTDIHGYYTNLYAWRYQANGAYDSTFGENGKSVPGLSGIGDLPMTVILRPDGKFYIAATVDNNMAVIRLTSSGALDQTFQADLYGNKGYVLVLPQPGVPYNTLASGIALQSDNKIIIGGSVSNSNYPNLGLARLDTSGAVDESFGNGGFQSTNINYYYGYANVVLRQPDDKIILAGYIQSAGWNFIVARYTKNGILDSSFGTNGYTTTDFAAANDFAYSACLQSDGKILLGGYGDYYPNPGYSSLEIARYNNDISVLPVTLLSFAATPQQNAISVNWLAGNQANTDYFVLEKSFDGIHFTPIYQTRTGAGSTASQQYGYIDNNPAEGDNFYRLQQKNTSGNSVYSKIVKAVFSKSVHISVYPNPVRNTLFVRGLTGNKVELLITDNTGKAIKKLSSASAAVLPVNVSSLPAGIYYLHILSGTQEETILFTK